jgi:Ca2+/Na+ antiporter
MKRIKQALQEIDKSVKKVDMFLLFIKTFVILTVSYLVLFMLKIKPYYAFIPAVVYFISSIFVEGRLDNVRRVEQKYDPLDEKLRTARDYKEQESVVLEHLEDEIVADLKNVRLSFFFPASKVFILMALLVLSVSASLYIASQDIRIIDFNQVWRDAVKAMERQEEKAQEEADFTTTEESIMEVGDEKIKVEINPVGMDFDFNDVTEDQDYEFSTVFPKDVFISSGSAYEDEFTEEQQALIKRYFDNKNN